MKEVDIVDEIETASSSSLIKEQSIALSEFVKYVALLCSIYNVGFRTMADVHVLGIGENRIERVDFILVFPS